MQRFACAIVSLLWRQVITTESASDRLSCRQPSLNPVQQVEELQEQCRLVPELQAALRSCKADIQELEAKLREHQVSLCLTTLLEPGVWIVEQAAHLRPCQHKGHLLSTGLTISLSKFAAHEPAPS